MRAKSFLLILLAASLMLGGCGKNLWHTPQKLALTPEEPVVSVSPSPYVASVAASVASEAVVEAPTPFVPDDVPPLAPPSLPIEGLATVYFNLDESVLSAESLSIIEQNAQALSGYAGRIAVEGHCDERGSDGYNIALGERRAVAVKKALTTFGVNESRMMVVSFGEEVPVDKGHDEGAWRQNRRVELRAPGR